MRAFVCVASAALALAAAPEQISTHYTQVDGVLAVDFVAVDSPGSASVSLSAGGPWVSVPTTSFSMPEVGMMHQALLPFNITTPGKAGFYKVATASGESVRTAAAPRGGGGGGGGGAAAAEADCPPWSLEAAASFASSSRINSWLCGCLAVTRWSRFILLFPLPVSPAPRARAGGLPHLPRARVWQERALLCLR